MEENEVILFYSSNAWHNYGSMDLEAVFTDQKAYARYLQDMRKDGQLSAGDIRQLEEINRTQGRELNYMMVTEELNPAYRPK